MIWDLIILLVPFFMVKVNAQKWPLSGSCLPCTCFISNTGQERFRVVDCSNLHLSSLPSNLPRDMDVLNFLNNNLKSHHINEISNYPFLQYLSLAYNKITSLQNSPFFQSSLITAIDFVGNTIDKLTEKSLEGLQNLKSLYGFKVTTVEPKAFIHLKQLRELELEIVEAEIPENIFDGLMISAFNFTVHKATRLPKKIFAFGKNNLKNLRFVGHQIEYLDEDLLKGLTFLKKIYLQLPKVTAIPERLFSNYNSSGTSSDSKPNNLQDIQLFEIQTLPLQVFHGLDHLVDLGIRKAEELPRNLFNNLINLQTLDLSETFISKIPTNWFINLNNLVSLSLSETSLRGLDSQSFVGLTQLKALNLSFNSLRLIGKNAFIPLRNTLEVLDISGNILKNIEATALSGMFSLRILDLSDNKMTSLPNGLFIDLIRLSSLNIQENKLSFLSTDLFHNQQRLSTLNLASNSFNIFPPALLQISGLLVNLDLSFNQIRDVGHCLAPRFAFLEYLNLRMNPLHCDCNILKLKDFRNVHMEGKCNSPEVFADLDIVNVTTPEECMNETCEDDLTAYGLESSFYGNGNDSELINLTSTEYTASTVDNAYQTSESASLYSTITPTVHKDEVPTDSNALFTADTNSLDSLNEIIASISRERGSPGGSDPSKSIFESIEFRAVIGTVSGFLFLLLFAVIIYLKRKYERKKRFVLKPKKRPTIEANT